MLGENPGDVQGDVPDAEDGDVGRLKGPAAGKVGMAVVPGDEVGGAVASGKVDAGNVERGVGKRPRGDDDRVVMLVHFGQGHIRADVDVAEQPDVPALKNVVQRVDDRLDAGMVGGDSVSNQPVGRRQPFEQVDGNVKIGL